MKNKKKKEYKKIDFYNIKNTVVLNSCFTVHSNTSVQYVTSAITVDCNNLTTTSVCVKSKENFNTLNNDVYFWTNVNNLEYQSSNIINTSTIAFSNELNQQYYAMNFMDELIQNSNTFNSTLNNINSEFEK